MSNFGFTGNKQIEDFSRYYSALYEDNTELFKEGVIDFTYTNAFALTEDIVKKEDDYLRNNSISESTFINYQRLENSLWCAAASERYDLPLVGCSKYEITDSSVVKSDIQKLSTILALKTINLCLPSLRECTPHEILEVRDELKDYLNPFWRHMKRLSFQLNLLINEHESNKIEDINHEAEFLIQSLIVPNIEQLNEVIEQENRTFFRNIFRKTINSTTIVAKIFDPTETYSKWDLIGKGIHGIMDINESNLEKCDKRSAIAYLIKIPKTIENVKSSRNSILKKIK